MGRRGEDWEDSRGLEGVIREGRAGQGKAGHERRGCEWCE